MTEQIEPQTTEVDFTTPITSLKQSMDRLNFRLALHRLGNGCSPEMAHLNFFMAISSGEIKKLEDRLKTLSITWEWILNKEEVMVETLEKPRCPEVERKQAGDESFDLCGLTRGKPCLIEHGHYECDVYEEFLKKQERNYKEEK